MKITFWGTRGSLPTSGPETQIYGGNTSCVSVSTPQTLLVLDAGSGIRRLGEMAEAHDYPRIDVLLTHLHMDHIQGLGFFAPLFNPKREVHIWGPASSTVSLPTRLNRYLSPPLFPVRIRDLPCRIAFHEVPRGGFEIGDFFVNAHYVCHPGPTVGYRISAGDKVLAYLPDHEPALGDRHLSLPVEWLSGWNVARNADLLIHDAQYSDEEYRTRVGWGHSTFEHALRFARLAGARRLALFHHDPSHSDEELREFFARYSGEGADGLQVSLAREGVTVEL